MAIIKAENGVNVEKPILSVYSIIKAFKGDRQVEKDKIEKMQEGFIKRGYIKMRPHERILFDTAVTVLELPDNMELEVEVLKETVIDKGLMIQDLEENGKIQICIYNPNPFLTEITKGENIAILKINYKSSRVETSRIKLLDNESQST